MSVAQRSNSPVGIALMLGSSVLFGVIFLLSGVVAVVPETIVAWRIIITACCYGSLLVAPRCRTALKRYVATVRGQRGGWWILVLLSVLVSAQLWLFMWAPAHQHALDVSLGYLLLPLVLVVAGRFVFSDSMTRMQWIAVGIAAVAVAMKTVLAGGLAWPVLLVSAGYTVYFMIRRHTRFDQTAGFGVEMALMSPVAVAYLLTQPAGEVRLIDATGVVAVGLLGTLAMALYLGSSAKLTMPVFGLLSYLEPVMLMGVALLLGESLSEADVAAYGLLGVALVLLSVDGFRRTLAR